MTRGGGGLSISCGHIPIPSAFEIHYIYSRSAEGGRDTTHLPRMPYQKLPTAVHGTAYLVLLRLYTLFYRDTRVFERKSLNRPSQSLPPKAVSPWPCPNAYKLNRMQAYEPCFRSFAVRWLASIPTILHPRPHSHGTTRLMGHAHGLTSCILHAHSTHNGPQTARKAAALRGVVGMSELRDELRGSGYGKAD